MIKIFGISIMFTSTWEVSREALNLQSRMISDLIRENKEHKQNIVGLKAHIDVQSLEIEMLKQPPTVPVEPKKLTPKKTLTKKILEPGTASSKEYFTAKQLLKETACGTCTQLKGITLKEANAVCDACVLEKRKKLTN